MARLKEIFESLVFFEVFTYMNSGNVMFSSHHTDIADMTQEIEQEILKIFQFEVKVLIIHHEALENIYQSIPLSWESQKGMLPHIAFLWQEIDNPDVLSNLEIDPKTDLVKYVPGAIVWNVELKNWSKGIVYKYVTNTISKQVTVRSINTIRKLVERVKK